jgi:hypothetical protein
MIRLVDAASVYPKILQAIAVGLFGAESKLVIAGLTLASAIC